MEEQTQETLRVVAVNKKCIITSSHCAVFSKIYPNISCCGLRGRCAPAVHIPRDIRLFHGHAVLSVLLTDMPCQHSVQSRAVCAPMRGFLSARCCSELNAEIHPGITSWHTSDLSLRPLGLMPSQIFSRMTAPDTELQLDTVAAEDLCLA